MCIDCYKTLKAAKSPSNGSGSGNKDDKKEVRTKYVFTFVFPVFLCIDEDVKFKKNIFHFPPQEKDQKRDLHGWLFCTSRLGNDPDKLIPT